ncbi:hypothetical protein HX792_14325 [Pseudomonas sp. B6002]|uniref:hypothetical protein n=1 Tax=Pseudomonas sp. B6002 TaxID=2726978 RepID=UPI0015A22BDD|nr:hypothetical protein [Pseudomonas sp. B6002]NVZ51518.1 hypothetical protein [Pseudomonas sp. B6002]
MPLPIIMSGPDFPGVTKPKSGPYKIPLTPSNQIMNIVVTPAVYSAFAPADQWRVSAQRNGSNPAGAYPINIISLESIAQQKMDTAINTPPHYFILNVSMLKTLTKNLTYTLRITLTDNNGVIKALAPNTSIMII